MTGLETLVELVRPWAKFYSRSDGAQTLLMFAHLGGMLWAGGLAVSADRAVWKLRTAAGEGRARLLAEISELHAPVLTGLTVAALSGVLLFTADLETYATSPRYWFKMGAFALLLVNGRWLQLQERRLQAAPATIPAGWRLLTVASSLSALLWFAVVLGGVLLMNA
ncbi:MAG: hypothetical protein FJ363_00625 [Gemmatimonadetes bacterium]|nr:hypothetical protein [Gemmatimonadota bacterium]